MTNPEKQIKSRFTKISTELAGEIVTALMDAESINIRDPEARAEVTSIIYDVFDDYEV